MNYYIEIILLPSAEVNLNFLWQKVYQQIHLALVESKCADKASIIGVSFPEYDVNRYYIGKKMRLFAENKETLEQMRCQIWLNRFKDYVQLSQINSTPEKLEGYACFKQIKFKGSREKLARRRAKRKSETLQQALAHFNGFQEQRSNLPYINMHSKTNRQYFRLFIEKQVMTNPQVGLYSCYGLSNTSTVPLF